MNECLECFALLHCKVFVTYLELVTSGPVICLLVLYFYAYTGLNRVMSWGFYSSGIRDQE